MRYRTAGTLGEIGKTGQGSNFLSGLAMSANMLAGPLLMVIHRNVRWRTAP
jgi:hypothetical protein